MYYYEVYVGEVRYQNYTPLTYMSKELLEIGQVVSAPYGNKNINGFIYRKVSKPAFETKMIDFVVSDIPLADDILKLHQWFLEYYPYGSGPVTRLFTPSMLSIPKKPKDTASLQTPEATPSNIQLTEAQTKAIDTITSSTSHSLLLHGQTGSGKTLIYVESAKKCLEQNQSVIVLVPEISLIAQTVNVFEQHLGIDTVTLHSELTRKQHSLNWLRLLESDGPQIVIGTRSAIFAPVKNLGLIVIDESHEPSYKQDAVPRYNALRVAAKRASLAEQTRIVYGSATPSITEYFLAKLNKAPILVLDSLSDTAKSVNKQIIDLRDKKAFSKHPYLSDPLISAIQTRLLKGEQSLIFLNRRGTAKQIICNKCGWQSLCPHCDLPLTLHADIHTSRCHTCGYTEKPAYACPVCRNSDIIYQSLGTKALQELLKSLFPEASLMRFDTDNTVSEKLINNYSQVRDGKVDIIVGTQMLGKGLDLPKLSLVGVINADISLGMPDYSSTERNYQLIHQAIGRVGRGHLNGQVILQTFRPDDKLIKAALYQNWSELYSSELKERQRFSFPPFCFMLKITVSRKNSTTAENYLAKLKKSILKISPNIDISGPMPSFYEKSHGSYNWHLLVRSNNRKNLTNLMKKLPSGNQVYDIDPVNLL